MVKAVLGIILLVVGGSIYLLQRTTSLLMFQVADGLGLTESVNCLRTMATVWPEFVVYSLPGGLWAASYILLVDAVFGGQVMLQRLAWASLIPMTGLVSELLQALRLCPGTADGWDALCYGLPFGAYLCYLMSYNKSRWKEGSLIREDAVVC